MPPLLGESTNKFKKLFNRNITRSKYNKMRNWFKGTKKSGAKVMPLQYNVGEVYEKNLSNRHGIPGNRGNINMFNRNLNRKMGQLNRLKNEARLTRNVAEGEKRNALRKRNATKGRLNSKWAIKQYGNRYEKKVENAFGQRLKNIKNNYKKAENTIRNMNSEIQKAENEVNKYKNLKNGMPNAKGNANVMSLVVPGTAGSTNLKNVEESLKNAEERSKELAANVERLQKMIMRAGPIHYR